LKICGVFDKTRGKNKIETLITQMCSELNRGSYYLNTLSMDNFGIGGLSLTLPEIENKPIVYSEGSKVVAAIGKLLDNEPSNKESENTKPGNKNIPKYLKVFSQLSEKNGKKLHEFLRTLNGSFVLVAYDVNTGNLVIANDKIGVKPLFYYHGESFLSFASEIKALLFDDKIERKINWDGWRDRFAYGYLLGTKTLFKNIYSLPNASILTFKNGKISLEKYWSYNEIEIDRSHSEEYFAKKGISFIREAIKKWTQGLKQCIVLLSGGYDSRCIAASLKNYTDVNFETFTTEHSFNDEIYAEQIAKCLKVKNTFVPRTDNLYKKYFIKLIELTEGAFTSDTSLWVMPLIEHLNKPSINLDGMAIDIYLKGFFMNYLNLKNVGHDRIFASILHQELQHRSRGAWPNLANYYHLIKSYSPSQAWQFFDDSAKAKLEPDINSVDREISNIRKNGNRVIVFFLKNRMRNVLSLAVENLMSRTMQNYTPFVESDLVEFGLSIPPKMKLNKKMYSKILKKSFPDVMKINSTNDLLPHSEVLNRIELMIAQFLPTPILELSRKMLGTTKILLSKAEIDVKTIDYLTSLLTNLTVPQFIKKNALLGCTHEYLNGKIDPRFFLEPLVEFCVWYNLFILGKSPEELMSLMNENNN